MTRAHYVVCFLASSFLTAAFLVPRMSEAMLMTGHACKPRGSTWHTDNYAPGGFVVVTPPAGSPMLTQLVCPINDEDGEPKWDATSVTVGVYDNATGSSCNVYACGTSWTGSLVHCGPTVTSGTSFTGATQLTLTPGELLPAWDPASFYWDFGWIGVDLNPNAGSKLMGVAMNF